MRNIWTILYQQLLVHDSPGCPITTCKTQNPAPETYRWGDITTFDQAADILNQPFEYINTSNQHATDRFFDVAFDFIQSPDIARHLVLLKGVSKDEILNLFNLYSYTQFNKQQVDAFLFYLNETNLCFKTSKSTKLISKSDEGWELVEEHVISDRSLKSRQEIITPAMANVMDEYFRRNRKAMGLDEPSREMTTAKLIDKLSEFHHYDKSRVPFDWQDLSRYLNYCDATSRFFVKFVANNK